MISKAVASFVLATGLPSMAVAARLTATPADWPTQYAAAKPGDTLKFVGSFPTRMDLPSRVFQPPLKIDATDAQFLDSVSFRNVTGIQMQGGVFGNPHGTTRQNRAIVFFGGSDIHVDRVKAVGSGTGGGIAMVGVTNGSVSNSTFTNLNVGIGIGPMSREIRVLNNLFDRATSDGIDIFGSHGVVASYNHCRDTRPAPGAHPDCVQMWSVKGNPVQSDIELSFNTAVGATQGLTSFNADNGGLLRARIVNNRVDVSYPQGIACYACRDSDIRNNDVTTSPGAQWRTTINVVGGKDVRTGGNRIGPRVTSWKSSQTLPMKMPGNAIVGYSIPTSDALQSAGYWPAIPGANAVPPSTAPAPVK
jgi:hypothetical protein